MTSITYIGMDVHTTNYTICAFQIDGEKVFGQTTINPDVKELVKYLTRLQERLGRNTKFICGYEAGCLGYTLYHDLKGLGYDCVILAPTTMAASPNEKIKTDKRDAVKIAKCLAYGTYSPVYVPTDEDNAVKEYIRMRDDAKTMLKQTKQQIIAFCTRHGKHFDGKSYWTQKHISWLGALQLKDEMLQETLTEYMLTYHQLSDKVDRYDKRIEELAQKESYSENVKKLVCFKGIKKRFPSAQQFAAFLGLVPRENSSGDKQRRFGITKAGNSHLRRLLTESANCFNRGSVGKKSKVLKARQAGNLPEVIAYADKGNERLRRRYIRIATRSKANIAKIAVARELACFVWGMMTGNLS